MSKTFRRGWHYGVGVKKTDYPSGYYTFTVQIRCTSKYSGSSIKCKDHLACKHGKFKDPGARDKAFNEERERAYAMLSKHRNKAALQGIAALKQGWVWFHYVTRLNERLCLTIAYVYTFLLLLVQNREHEQRILELKDAAIEIKPPRDLKFVQENSNCVESAPRGRPRKKQRTEEEEGEEGGRWKSGVPRQFCQRLCQHLWAASALLSWLSWS